jgi:hypothetical protein
MSWFRIVLLCLLLASPAAADVPKLNDFDLSNSEVPAAEIRPGGPGRDGIPALRDPAVLPAGDAPWADDDLVLAIEHRGEARAYPIAILDWHELVNDTLGGEPILVTYCPLCGTGLVFDRRVDGKVRSFGVSGLLYLSDVLFYDRETDSLWSQIHSRAVTGPSRGKRLRMMRSEMALWGEWRQAHPHTTVLSRETGHRRDYNRSPYAGYSASERILFPVEFDRRYSAKMPTIGVRLVGGAARAYPAVEVARAGGNVNEEFEGRRVRVSYDPEAQIFEVEAPDDVEVVEGYWFAWSAFHPEATTYVARK